MHVLYISDAATMHYMHGYMALYHAWHMHMHASLNDKLMHTDCFCIGCRVESGLDNLHVTMHDYLSYLIGSVGQAGLIHMQVKLSGCDLDH